MSATPLLPARQTPRSCFLGCSAARADPVDAQVRPPSRHRQRLTPARGLPRDHRPIPHHDATAVHPPVQRVHRLDRAYRQPGEQRRACPSVQHPRQAMPAAAAAAGSWAAGCQRAGTGQVAPHHHHRDHQHVQQQRYRCQPPLPSIYQEIHSRDCRCHRLHPPQNHWRWQHCSSCRWLAMHLSRAGRMKIQAEASHAGCHQSTRCSVHQHRVHPWVAAQPTARCSLGGHPSAVKLMIARNQRALRGVHRRYQSRSRQQFRRRQSRSRKQSYQAAHFHCRHHHRWCRLSRCRATQTLQLARRGSRPQAAEAGWPVTSYRPHQSRSD